jgi:hypothetical protein
MAVGDPLACSTKQLWNLALKWLVAASREEGRASSSPAARGGRCHGIPDALLAEPDSIAL